MKTYIHFRHWHLGVLWFVSEHWAWHNFIGSASNSDPSISWSARCRLANPKLEENVDLSLPQNESIVARLMHITNSSSVGQSKFLFLSRMLKKWQFLHWNRVIRWSPSLAIMNQVKSSSIKYSSSTKEFSKSLTTSTGNLSFGCWKKQVACQAPKHTVPPLLLEPKFPHMTPESFGITPWHAMHFFFPLLQEWRPSCFPRAMTKKGFQKGNR